MSLLGSFFWSEELDLVFLHVLGLLNPLIDKLLGPRKLISERHQSLPVALNDIMDFYLILDSNQLIHDVGVIKLLINLGFASQLNKCIFEVLDPFSNFLENSQCFWMELIADTRVVRLEVFFCNFLRDFHSLGVRFAS